MNFICHVWNMIHINYNAYPIFSTYRHICGNIHIESIGYMCEIQVSAITVEKQHEWEGEQGELWPWREERDHIDNLIKFLSQNQE